MGHRMLLPLAYLPLDRYNDQKEGIVKGSTRFLYLVTRTLAERARELLRFLQALVKGNLKQAAVELGNAPKVHSCISATLVFIMAGFIPRFFVFTTLVVRRVRLSRRLCNRLRRGLEWIDCCRRECPMEYSRTSHDHRGKYLKDRMS